MRLRPTLLLACCALALALATAGCGGVGAGTASRRASGVDGLSPSSAGPLDGDKDVDRFGEGRYDTDNDANPTFGPAASPAERAAVIALIRRYYAIAASGDGTKACSLLDPLVAEAVAEGHDLGGGASPPRGGTCARVAGEVFSQHRRELAEDVATLRVGWVQLQAKQAVALLHFGTTRERIERLRRRQGSWRMFALLDNGPL